jgi:hypothetical protein
MMIGKMNLSGLEERVVSKLIRISQYDFLLLVDMEEEVYENGKDVDISWGKGYVQIWVLR